MPVEIATKDDLNCLKTELIQTITKLLTPKVSNHKEWLRSGDVRKLLSISPGTLQTLRINGTLPHTRVGGSIYYAYADVMNVLEENKHQ